MNNLPSKLRSIIAVRNLLQKDIATRAGVSDAYVSDLLAGRRNIPPLALNKLMDAIGIGSRKMRQRLHRAGARDAGWTI